MHREILRKSTQRLGSCRRQWLSSVLVACLQLYWSCASMSYTAVWAFKPDREARYVHTSCMFSASTPALDTGQTGNMHHIRHGLIVCQRTRKYIRCQYQCSEQRCNPFWVPGSAAFKPSGVCIGGIDGSRNRNGNKLKTELINNLQQSRTVKTGPSKHRGLSTGYRT